MSFIDEPTFLRKSRLHQIIDFRNTRFDLNFWCYVMPCGATLCKLVFSSGIAAWEQRHTWKTIWLKIFPNLLFHQFISKLFASRSTLCHLSMTQRSWENLDYIKFKANFRCVYWGKQITEAKNFSGICYTVVSEHTPQVSISCDTFCSFYNTY